MMNASSETAHPRRDNLLLIAARSPVPGQTKTRLGATIGMERAAALYSAFLKDLANRFADGSAGRDDFDFGWAYTPESAPFDAVLREIGFDPDCGYPRFVSQEGETWGERQTHLLRWGALQGYARTVLTASDSPHMSVAMIERAFVALVHCDVVVGRVHDGGYYLIGVRGFHDVLTGVPMSTAGAADALVARALAMGLRVARIESTFDVDVEADLDLLRELLARDPEAAPATLRALNALRLIPETLVTAHNTP